MGDERTIAALFGKRQRITEMTFSLIRQTLMEGNLAEKAKYPCFEAALPTLTGNDQCALGDRERVRNPMGGKVGLTEIELEKGDSSAMLHGGHGSQRLLQHRDA